MRVPMHRRALTAAALASLLAACGGDGSPTGPEMPAVVVATGPQILRITFQGSCNTPDGRSILPLLYSRVVVTRSGNEWIARAASAEAGDVELRFHPSGTGAITGSMPVAGTITGTAIHSQDVFPNIPSANARIGFGTDGRTSLNGFAFSASALTPASGVSGVGSGAVTMSDDNGRSCSGSSFSWGLGSST